MDSCVYQLNPKNRPLLEIVPIDLAGANAFVDKWHRHHGPTVGHKFSIGLSDGTNIVGVAIVGRPVARLLQDGFTVEVLRCCVMPGIKNGCSKLYSAAWRAAKAMGYRRILTYTLIDETGVSLVAAGWKVIAQSAGGTWSRPSRPKVDKHPLQEKLRWEPILQHKPNCNA